MNTEPLSDAVPGFVSRPIAPTAFADTTFGGDPIHVVSLAPHRQRPAATFILTAASRSASTFDSPSRQYRKRNLRSSKALPLADMSVMTYNALHVRSRQAACMASWRSKDTTVFEESAR